MEKTRFRGRVRARGPGRDGSDARTGPSAGSRPSEFLLSPNPGEELRPLARIASGGELSRILLALNSVAASTGRGKTLVFDEVDAGIGGRVAEVVGRKLRALAERHQVLCVTHLPQIASLADRHFAVRKRVEQGPHGHRGAPARRRRSASRRSRVCWGGRRSPRPRAATPARW